jgi:hypothetical protein
MWCGAVGTGGGAEQVPVSFGEKVLSSPRILSQIQPPCVSPQPEPSQSCLAEIVPAGNAQAESLTWIATKRMRS